jgi:hypothetical protein
MASYRTELTKIGIAASASVSYLGFDSKPKSFRQAMASMSAPGSEAWSQVSDIFRDDDWTDEIQGVAWDGSHWIFSANANQDKPGHNDKAIYSFKGGATLADDAWASMVKYKDVPHPISGLHESDDHWGQVTFFEGSIFVAHFWEGGQKPNANVVVFDDADGMVSYNRWIELDLPTSPTDGRHARAEFQAINPWDGLFYTCFGDGDIHEFFMHDPESGNWTGKTLKLNPPVTQVQGACFSPNGHLYISTNAPLPSDDDYQTIRYYSPLNGHQFGVIPVLADQHLPDQELEGLCFANVTVPDGQPAQIHAVLLENHDLAIDNIFFKSFACSTPMTV